MARPPKDPSERKDVDLRVPVTAEQKKLVSEAAAADGADVAAWIRPIVIQAAQNRLHAKSRKRGG